MRPPSLKNIVSLCIEEYFDRTTATIAQYMMEVVYAVLTDIVTAVKLPPDIIKTGLMGLIRHNIVFCVELPVVRNGHELNRKHMVYGIYPEQALVRLVCPVVLSRVADLDSMGDQLLTALSLGGSMTVAEISDTLHAVGMNLSISRLQGVLSLFHSRGIVQRSTELKERCQSLLAQAYYASHNSTKAERNIDGAEPLRKQVKPMLAVDAGDTNADGETYCLNVERVLALFQEEELADYIVLSYDQDMGAIFRAALTISNSFQVLGFCPFMASDVRPSTRSFNTEQLYDCLMNTQQSFSATCSAFTIHFCTSALNLYTSEKDAVIHMAADGQYVVDIDAAMKRMKMSILLRIVAERHGMMARRIINLISARGMMEAAVVAAEGMIQRTQVVSLLAALHSEGYLQMTMLSNSTEPKTENSYFMYSINPRFPEVATDAALICLYNVQSKLKQVEELQLTLLAIDQVQRINDHVELLEPIYIKLLETVMLLL